MSVSSLVVAEDEAKDALKLVTSVVLDDVIIPPTDCCAAMFWACRSKKIPAVNWNLILTILSIKKIKNGTNKTWLFS